MYGCGSRGKHESSVVVVFFRVMKNNDVAGFVKSPVAFSLEAAANEPLLIGTYIHLALAQLHAEALALLGCDAALVVQGIDRLFRNVGKLPTYDA